MQYMKYTNMQNGKEKEKQNKNEKEKKFVGVN